MSNETNGNRRVELYDGSGAVEAFVPEQVLRQVGADRDALRARLTHLEDEQNNLRQELEKARRERDRYKTSLQQALGLDIPRMTAEELEDLRANGVSQEEFLRQIDRLFTPKPTGV